MKFRKKIFNFHFLLLSAVLLIATFLRLYKISDYMTFLGDEGRDALVVYNILHGHLTFLGPTASVGGFFMGPIYFYFMAPFLWLFGYNPVGPAVMVALFGVATVYLVYKVGSEFFGEKAGLIACALYAVSPLTVAYSRSSWNPNLMPFFSLLTAYILYKAVSKNNLRLFIFVGILYGIIIQLHYIEIFFGVAIILYVFLIGIIQAKGLSLQKKIFGLLKNYLSIFVGFLIGWSPFLLFELRHGFPNIKSILNFIFQSGNTGSNNHLANNIEDVFFRLFGRLLTTFPPPEQLYLYNGSLIQTWRLLTLLLAILSIGILFFKYSKTFKQKGIAFQQYSILILWFFIGIIFFGFYRKAIHDYYFEFLFPLPFLLVGNALSFISNKGKLLKLISVFSFLILFAINLNEMPFKSLPNRQFYQVKEITEFVLSKTDNKPFNFALITPGNSDHAYRYIMKLEKRDPVIIETTEKDPGRKTVTDQLLVICEDPKCEPVGNSLWEVVGFGRAEIKDTWDVSVVKVYKLVHYKGK